MDLVVLVGPISHPRPSQGDEAPHIDRIPLAVEVVSEVDESTYAATHPLSDGTSCQGPTSSQGGDPKGTDGEPDSEGQYSGDCAGHNARGDTGYQSDARTDRTASCRIVAYL